VINLTTLVIVTVVSYFLAIIIKSMRTWIATLLISTFLYTIYEILKEHNIEINIVIEKYGIVWREIVEKVIEVVKLI